MNDESLRDAVTSIIISKSERVVRRRSRVRSKNGKKWSSRYEGKADAVTMNCLDVLIPAICQVNVEEVKSNLKALGSLKSSGETKSSTGCESFSPAAALNHLSISSAKMPFVFGTTCGSSQTCGTPFSFSVGDSYKAGMATPFKFSSSHQETSKCKSTSSDEAEGGDGVTPVPEQTTPTAFVFGATNSTSGSCDSGRRKKPSTKVNPRKRRLCGSISPGGGEGASPACINFCDQNDTSPAGLTDAPSNGQHQTALPAEGAVLSSDEDPVEPFVPRQCLSEFSILSGFDRLYSFTSSRTIIEVVEALDHVDRRSFDYKQARVMPKPVTRCTCAGSANQHPCICAYVNFVCPLSGLSLLHFAVMAKNAEIVEELLSWGADTDVTNQEASSSEEFHALPPHFQGISPLYMAVAMGSCEVVRKLIGAGAKPHIAKCLRSGAHISTWELAMENHDIFEVLLSNTDKNRIPLRYAVMCKMFGCSEVQDIDLVQWSLWNPCCLVNWDLCRTIGKEDIRELNRLLLADPKTRQEKLVKALYVQSFLEGICNKNRRLNYGSLRLPTVVYRLVLNGGLDKCRGWHKSVVAVLTSICKELIEEELNADLGAGKCYLAGEVVSGSMHGLPLRDEIWTNDLGGVVCKICLERVRKTDKVSPLPYLENTSYSSTGWVDELSSPCLLPAAVRYGSLGGGNRPDIGEDKALQLLIETAKLPWLPNVEALPTERDGYHVLHDGPTCHDHVELSPEQHRISLLMCSSSGSTLYSLQESCRHAVLSCIRPPNVLSSIEKLPLPASLIDFLLLG